MKKNYFSFLCIVFLVFFTGCFEKNTENDMKIGEGIFIELENEYVNVYTKEKLLSAEFELKGDITEEDIKVSSNYLHLKQKINNEILLATAFLYEKEDNISFKIKKTDKMEINIKNSIKKDNLYNNDIKRNSEPKLLGDFNFDMCVDLMDFNLLKQNFGKKGDNICDIAPALKGTDGPYKDVYAFSTPDLKVDLQDLTVFSNNFGKIIVGVSTVNINPEYNRILKGESVQLEVKVLYYGIPLAENFAENWISSDNEIATVDNTGKVTAKNIGITTITAISKGVSGTAKIEVYSEGFDGIKVYAKDYSYVYSWGSSDTKYEKVVNALVDEGNGWKSFKYEKENSINLIFRLNKDDWTGKTENLSRVEKGEYWYLNGEWHKKLPQNIFIPYIGPYLTLINPKFVDSYNTPTVLNPNSNIVINYEIKNVPSDFVAAAYYREKGQIDWKIQQEDFYPSFGSEWGKVHHITLNNLKSDTIYEYKVTGLNDAEFSKTYEFKTTKSDINYSDYLVVGDMQDEQGTQRWKDIADEIVKSHINDFEFIILLGDMAKDDTIYQNDRFYWWKVFFDKGKELFASKPMLPTMGNHDTPANDIVKDYSSNAECTRSFRKYFYINPDMSYPDYYSFKFGNSNFIAFNSEIPIYYGQYPSRDNGGSVAKQAVWFQNIIEKEKQNEWNFVYMHCPMINPAGGKDEVKYVRPYVEYLYDDMNYNNVDWVFAGHTHTYQRLKPLKAKKDSYNIMQTHGRGINDGIGFIVVPPAGQHPRVDIADKSILDFYPKNDKGEVAIEIGFTIVNIYENKFSAKIYGMGTVGDRAQPQGYRTDTKKILLDSIEYTK